MGYCVLSLTVVSICFSFAVECSMEAYAKIGRNKALLECCSKEIKYGGLFILLPLVNVMIELSTLVVSSLQYFYLNSVSYHHIQ